MSVCLYVYVFPLPLLSSYGRDSQKLCSFMIKPKINQPFQFNHVPKKDTYAQNFKKLYVPLKKNIFHVVQREREIGLTN